MKNKLFLLFRIDFFLIVFLILGLAAPVSPVAAGEDADRLAGYRAIWKAQFMRLNGISEDEFNQRVSVVEEMFLGEKEKDYWVKYSFANDWVKVEQVDQFAVFLSSADEGYKHLPLPRDTYFGAGEIELVIAKRVGGTQMTSVKVIPRLAFASLEEAKAKVMKESGITVFRSAEVSYFVPGKLPRSDGMPYLLFSGTKEAVPSTSPGNPKPLGPPPDAVPPERGDRNEVDPATVLPAGKQTTTAEPSLQGCVPPRPGKGGPSPSRGTKGYLNLVTGELHHYEDTFVYY